MMTPMLAHATPALLVVLAALTTARITRLVNDDAILDTPRAWLVRHLRPKASYFITCPWCVSIYVGAAVAAATYWWHGHWWVQYGLLLCTCSYVTGWLATAERRMGGG